MNTSDRFELRKIFFDAWQKHTNQLPLEPLESQLILIMVLHPEYHSFLTRPDLYQEKEFESDNPFLHMSLHLGLREQLSTDRPAGIRALFKALCQKTKDPHEVEHQMMTILARLLWQAQQSGTLPDEKNYLSELQHLLGKTS